MHKMASRAKSSVQKLASKKRKKNSEETIEITDNESCERSDLLFDDTKDNSEATSEGEKSQGSSK